MWEEAWRVFTLGDYNTRVVMAGTGLLGLAAGVVGVFLVLRKRALLSDAVSHATLPGVVLAFWVSIALGMTGRSLPVLLSGAAMTGLLGMGAIVALRRYSPIKDDAALAIVLSVFFGAGIALFGMVQNVEGVHAAGLTDFIYGKTASMLLSDTLAIGAVALGVCGITVALFKEFRLLCFDEAFAAVQGWPVLRLDLLLMGLIVLVTVIGLQAVGLILVVALLIIPPVTARLWTHRLGTMTMLSGLFGMLGAGTGSLVSALFERMPSGALIVLSASGFFFLSLMFGTEGGVVPRLWRRARLRRRIRRQHLLRRVWEMREQTGRRHFHARGLVERHGWLPAIAALELRAARRAGIVRRINDTEWELTPLGESEAARAVRNHRLWELYLITHADVAPSHVDSDADRIEHVLDPEMIRELEELLARERETVPPPSPHRLDAPPDGGGNGR